MGAQPKPMDVEAFLVWEERQELRHEFDGAQIFAMTGGTNAHAAIQRNLIFSLTGRLRGQPCQAFGSELKIRTQTSIRYPDAFVTCSRGEPNATVVADPVVIFEILSRSTAKQDLGAKNTEYQSIPSVQRYVVLQQTHRAADVFFRTKEEDNPWAFEFLSDGDVLDMPEIGISIPLAEIYEDIALAGRGLKSL